MTDEELARIRTFSLRGHEADGTMYPGGSLCALQELLGYVDELKLKLEESKGFAAQFASSSEGGQS
jgi:hypothetical protein